MAEVKILKTDSRGRITLPPPFRNEPLFEYMVPDMSNLPTEKLSPQWIEGEENVNKDTRDGISASTPVQAMKRIKR